MHNGELEKVDKNEDDNKKIKKKMKKAVITYGKLGIHPTGPQRVKNENKV